MHDDGAMTEQAIRARIAAIDERLYEIEDKRWRWGLERLQLRHRIGLVEGRLETEPTFGFRAVLYERQDQYRYSLRTIDERCDALAREEGLLLDELAELTEHHGP